MSVLAAPALSIAEAAEATGLTTHTLEQYRQLRKRGVVRGPDFVQFGRSVLYSREAVDAFIASRTGER
jgi:predicted DNA-binding transcriptional regulator AlpA